MAFSVPMPLRGKPCLSNRGSSRKLDRMPPSDYRINLHESAWYPYLASMIINARPATRREQKIL